MKQMIRILAFTATILLVVLAACGQTAQPVVTSSPAALPPAATKVASPLITRATTPLVTYAATKAATALKTAAAPTAKTGVIATKGTAVVTSAVTKAATKLATQAVTPGATAARTPLAPVTGTSGITPDLADAFNRLMQLGGFHFEGTFQVTSTTVPSQYIRFMQDVDASGNMHLLAYTEQDGQPVADIYYVNQHLYVGQGGQYSDLGQQSAQDVTNLYQLYVLPFQLTLSQSTDLTQVGTETVNGVPTTKYQINLGQFARDYLQLSQNATFTSNSFVWYSNQYQVPVRSDINATWADGSNTGQVKAHTEVTEIGKVAPIQAPAATVVRTPTP